MTDKELIQALKHCGDPDKAMCYGCPARKVCRENPGLPIDRMAADRLEALLAENEALNERDKVHKELEQTLKRKCAAMETVIEQLNIELQAMRNAANGYKKMVPQWVSVDERLPESNDEQVLVVVNGIYEGIHFHDAIEIAEFNWNEGWILESWPDWGNPCVKFWQPLPEPPSTEGGGVDESLSSL